MCVCVCVCVCTCSLLQTLTRDSWHTRNLSASQNTLCTQFNISCDEVRYLRSQESSRI